VHDVRADETGTTGDERLHTCQDRRVKGTRW
jgi:hypothetical protein